MMNIFKKLPSVRDFIYIQNLCAKKVTQNLSSKNCIAALFNNKVFTIYCYYSIIKKE